MDLLFNTYLCAYDHALSYSHCAHLACSLVVNGEIIAMANNSVSSHAECNALSALSMVQEGEKHCVLCAGQ